MHPVATSPEIETAMSRARDLRAEAFAGFFRRLFGKKEEAANTAAASGAVCVAG